MITTKQAASAANITGAQVCYLLRKYPQRLPHHRVNPRCIVLDISAEEFLAVYRSLPKAGDYTRKPKQRKSA